jgi:transcription elongation factor SPT5
MDQNGAVRVVTPSEVTARRDNKNFAVAQDSNGNDMKVGDAMKEVGGEVSLLVSICQPTS